MRKILLSLTIILALSMNFTTYAGQWKQDETGWWYQNDDGSVTKDTWKWIDGNEDGISECYYFGDNGILYVNTITPDGYYVNEDGAWVDNGIVQEKIFEQSKMVIDPRSDNIYISKRATPRGYENIEKEIKVNSILGIENVEIYMEDGVLMGKYISSSNNKIPKITISYRLYYEDGTTSDISYTQYLLKNLEFSLTDASFNERVNSVDIVIRDDT